jgi:hypothetical protein
VHRDGKDAGVNARTAAPERHGIPWRKELVRERECVCSWAGAGRWAVRILGRACWAGGCLVYLQIFLTSMKYTSHLFGTSMNYYGPLDAQR